MNIKLNDLEQRFLDKYIDSDKIHPGSQIYWDMAKKIMTTLNSEHLLGTSLVSNRANDIAERILFKIACVEVDEFLEEMRSVPQPIKKQSTKALSLEATQKDKAQTEMKIRSALASSETPLSRKDLSERTGLRLSSVCGRINEMVSNGSVVVVDTKWDKDSQRQVQTLKLK